MAQIEWYLYLTASTLYAVSVVFFILSFAFRKEHWSGHAVALAFIGLVPHSLSLIVRWIEAGHGPYYTFYEAQSSFAWVCVVVFLALQYRIKKLQYAGIIVMSVTFLMMGLGFVSSKAIDPLPSSLQSYWLIAHVGFAKLAFGSILLATGLAVLYILKNNNSINNKYDEFYIKLPNLKTMDDLMYQFIAAGFLFLSIMIASGSIWAYQTWGRYWAWDPVETWSLIAWFVYAIYLHQRLNAGWMGKKAAWMLVFGIFILAFSLFGTGIVYAGLHSAYMV